MHDFADFAHRHVLHQVVHHTRLDVDHRLAGRARLAQLVFRLEYRGQRRYLGLAVEVPQAYPRQSPLHFAQHLDWHDGRAVVALAQRA